MTCTSCARITRSVSVRSAEVLRGSVSTERRMLANSPSVTVSVAAGRASAVQASSCPTLRGERGSCRSQ